MSNVALSELQKIPYLDGDNLEGRFISTLMFHADNDWHMWVQTDHGLIKIRAWPAEMFYFSATKQSDEDIYFHFLDFFSQRANMHGLQKAFIGLHDDFLNLATALAKIDLFFRSKDETEVKMGVAKMVATEVEYIFSVCRSIFDLLQEIIAKLWETIRLHDTTVTKKPLKDTFRKMVLHGDRPVTVEHLTGKFGLPKLLAEFYVRNTEFFLTLRKFRDSTIHHGSPVPLIFSTEKGFAVSGDLLPFSKFDVWTDEHKQPNNLCSLRPAIGYVIQKTISICEDFSQTIEQIIQFPAPIAPGMKLFMRGYFNASLISNFDAVAKCQWWSG